MPKIKWKHVRAGAIFTALLFMLGRYLIGLYIEFSQLNPLTVPQAHVIIILLWIMLQRR